jgi:cathepsin D
LYSFPCATPPQIAFNWGGKDWVISGANINLGLIEDGSSMCVGALAGQDIGLGDGVWLLGDSFMKNVYSVFDFGTNTVGFASLR